jgi:hypothetical protein
MTIVKYGKEDDMMNTAYVVLYLTFASSITVEVPQHFTTMDECRASFDAIQMKRSARSGWMTPEYSLPMGFCLPVMDKT